MFKYLFLAIECKHLLKLGAQFSKYIYSYKQHMYDVYACSMVCTTYILNKNK